MVIKSSFVEFISVYFVRINCALCRKLGLFNKLEKIFPVMSTNNILVIYIYIYIYIFVKVGSKFSFKHVLLKTNMFLLLYKKKSRHEQ